MVKRLVREVYNKPEFKKWAKRNVVLVELDFQGTKLTTIQKQNRSFNKCLELEATLPFGL